MLVKTVAAMLFMSLRNVCVLGRILYHTLYYKVIAVLYDVSLDTQRACIGPASCFSCSAVFVAGTLRPCNALL